MKAKFIIGGIVILAGIALAAVNFFDANIEYGSFATARTAHKKIQVKGEWIRERGSSFDPSAVQFSFYLRDDNGDVEKVVLDGAKPNNFEAATSVVVQGKYTDDCFRASGILTKCPSKYQGTAPESKKSI
jgi:cytochrome c-type biogenesis protein CcmE